jgi:hypothetical protein
MDKFTDIYFLLRLIHRYQKSLNKLLKVCYVPATSAILIASFSSFFAATINSTNEANKADIKQSIYIDVYGLIFDNYCSSIDIYTNTEL